MVRGAMKMRPLKDDINYCVVTFANDKAGNLSFECHGPFKTKKEARAYAKTIVYPCLKFVEMLWS
jgi:hypothetical protein